MILDLEQFFIQLVTYGYVGILGLSFVGNLLIFVPIPYLLVIFALGALPDLHPVLIGLSGGLGATLGKVVIYAIGASGSRLLGKEKERNLEFARRVIERYGGAFAIFLFAALPLPDDILYLPLGVIRYNIANFFLSCLVGKVVLTLFIAYSGRLSLDFVRQLIGGGGTILELALIIITIVVSVYATLRVDWESVFMRYVDRES